MRFPQVLARLESAVFDRLGELAQWGVQDGAEGVAVRVRRARQGDEDFRLDFGQLVVAGALLRVRRSDVAEPVEGDQVQILDDDGNAIAGELYQVAAEPRLDAKKGVWTCQVRPAA